MKPNKRQHNFNLCSKVEKSINQSVAYIVGKLDVLNGRGGLIANRQLDRVHLCESNKRKEKEVS